MAEVKKLYIGTCMSDLNKKSTYNFEQTRSIRLHINHSDRTFQAAEEARLGHDEERAYILYMRYLDIFQKVRASREYKKDESHYSLLLGSKFRDAIARAEKLSISLRKRFEETKSSKENQDFKDNVSSSPKKAVISTSAPESNTKTEGITNGVADMKKQYLADDVNAIKVEKLYELLFGSQSATCEMLVCDIRSAEDFEASHIRHRSCINVPKTSITPGSVSSKIEKGIVDEDHKTKWKNRAMADVVMMVDWHSTKKRLDETHDPLRSLKDALWKWEQNIFLKHEPVVLEGGYSEWLDFYPQFSTNPRVKRPSLVVQKDISINSLFDFSYRDLKKTKQNGVHEEAENGFGDTENEENWLDAELIEESSSPSFKSPANITNGEVQPTTTTTTEIYPEIPNDIYLGRNKKASESEPIYAVVNKDKPAVGSSDNSTVKSTPTIDRTTKPKIPSRNLKPPTLGESPKTERKSDNGINLDSWPPMSFVDSPKEKPKSRTEAQESEIEATIMRINAMKKKTEEEREKTEKIKEQQRLAELKAQEKRMKEEHEEQERQRKQAEKEFADQIRALGKPRQLSAKKEESDTQKPSGDSTQTFATEKPTPPAAAMSEQPVVSTVPQENSVKKPVVDRQKKPALEEKNIAPDAEVKSASQSSVPDTSASAMPTKESVPVKPLIDDFKPQEKVIKSSEHIPVAKKVTPAPQPVLPKPALSVDTVKVDNGTTSDISKTAGKRNSGLPNEEVRPLPSSDIGQRPKPKETRLSQDAAKQLIKTNDTKANSQMQVNVKKMQNKPRALPLHEAAKPSRSETNTLPVNYEKKLDKQTGRYYYVDHKAKTTQWTLPDEVKDQMIKKVPLKDDGASSTGGGLKRSFSSPNIADLIKDEQDEELKPSIPNRSNKPSFNSGITPDSTEEFARRLQGLHPVFGGPGPGLCGLQNLGNTCYMNSVLQCMLNTTHLTEYFLNNLYKRDINRENFLGSGGEITDGFASLLKAVWTNSYKHLTPREFRYTISKINPRFGGYIQQDSQELLLFLLDGLHEDLNRITKRTYVEQEDNDNISDEEAAKRSWDYHKKLNESIIVELFQGQFKATVQCMHCKKSSRKFDVFMYLSLPVLSQNCSINDCIERFSKPEKLSGDNMWRCPTCKKEREAVRRIEIWKLPPVLLIHFKRFSFCGRWRDKIQSSVSFPESGLELQGYVKGPKKRSQYNLYSVSHHHGASLDSGHYVASCKSPLNNQWYKFDDSEVYRTSVPQGPSAYILCYTSLSHSLKISAI